MIPYLRNLDRGEFRRALKQLTRDNERWPLKLTRVDPFQWQPAMDDPTTKYRTAVWRSRAFMVQVFEYPTGVIRLSVNRTAVEDKSRKWRDGITWDQLQNIKSEVGYGDRDAVEVYPPDVDVVNVANIRHVWILTERLSFVWRDEA